MKTPWSKYYCLIAAFMILERVAVAQVALQLPEISPEPQDVLWTYDEPRWLEWKRLTGFFLEDRCKSLEAGIRMLNARAGELGLEPLPAHGPKEAGMEKGIMLALGPDAKSDAGEGLFMGIPVQGYHMLVSDSSVGIVADGLPGLFYGLMTLHALLSETGRVPCVSIRDAPDMPWRGAYIGGGNVPGGSIEEAVSRMAAMKVNFLVFETSDFYHLDNPETADRWRRVAQRCREHFIEPVPELQSLGWGGAVLKIEPRAVEGLTVERQPCVVRKGVLEPAAPAQPPSAPPLVNVVFTEASPLTITDSGGNVVYEAGKDYRVAAAGTEAASPAIKPPYAADARPLCIEAMEGGRLQEGDTVLVTYDYAPPDSVTCCPSEPLYQEVMRKAIQATMTCMEPRFLHIGHDEPRCLNRDRRCRVRGLSNADLFVDDVARMLSFAREANPQVRLMMWADAVNPFHNAPQLALTGAAEKLPREIIQCLWFYHHPDPSRLVEQSIDYFTDLGFFVTGSPWFDHQNVHHWTTALATRVVDTSRVLGLLYTSWNHPEVDPWQALPTAAEYSWSFDKPDFTVYRARQRKR